MKPGMRLYLAIILCVSLAACGGGGDNTGNGEDTTVPTAEASPPGGSTISGSRQVMITFDESMDPASLRIGGTMAGECGTMIWSKNVHENDTLTISPTVAWPAGTGTLLIKASDLAGNPLVELSLTYTVDSTAHMVSALYNNNGSDWNDYVKKDGTDEFSASDTACTGDEIGGYDACLHGGEMRVVEVTGKTSCTGLTATDALGAFDWTCIVDAGTVKMVSTGLADGKNLSDLLDFTTPGWKDNSVTVLDGGVEYFATLTAAWWTNPVVVDNDGGYLNAAGTIYAVTNDVLSTGYIITAPSVGLVGQPGVIINGPAAGTGSYVVSADGSAGARDFLWLEGAVDAAGDDVGVYLKNVGFSVLRNVKAENADTGALEYGVYLRSSPNNKLSGLTATNNGGGVYFGSSSGNTLSGVSASNNTSYGVTLDNSSGNTLSGVTASNNLFDGVYLYSSSNNTLSGVTASNNNSNGVRLYFSDNNTLSGVTASNNNSNGVRLYFSDNNTLSGVTASNNSGYGVYLYSSSNNTLSGVTASNNGTGVFLSSSSNNNTLSGVTAANNGNGICLDNSSNNTLNGVTASNNLYGINLSNFSNNNTLTGVTASNNTRGVWLYYSSDNTLSGVTASSGDYGVCLTNSSNNYFTGPLKVGNNTWDCFVSGGTTPGLVDTTCSTSGDYLSGGTGGYGIGNISDATLYNGITLAGSFVAKVTADDTANSSDTNGTSLYDNITDWSHFQNAFRGWGKDGPAFPNTDNRVRCTSGTCRIWDWSLRLGDTGDAGNPAILGVLSLPAGDDTLTHTWSDATTTTLLRNAVEIQGDGLGNENTLCESGETCLYNPNIGSYQGHGSLESAGAFTDGDPITGITGVTLMKYKTNGY